MPENITRVVSYNKKALHAAIIPQLRTDGMHYEINIKGYPRFLMKWSALGRYDALNAESLKLPYQLVLAVSDVLEKEWPGG
jgi:hypothetical protein